MSDEFRIDIHKAAGYVPSPEVVEALEALAAAVAEEDGDEVSGFSDQFSDYRSALMSPEDTNITVCSFGKFKSGGGGTECSGVYFKFP